jgi:hypothetical protein
MLNFVSWSHGSNEFSGCHYCTLICTWILEFHSLSHVQTVMEKNSFCSDSWFLYHSRIIVDVLYEWNWNERCLICVFVTPLYTGDQVISVHCSVYAIVVNVCQPVQFAVTPPTQHYKRSQLEGDMRNTHDTIICLFVYFTLFLAFDVKTWYRKWEGKDFSGICSIKYIRK